MRSVSRILAVLFSSPKRMLLHSTHVIIALAITFAVVFPAYAASRRAPRTVGKVFGWGSQFGNSTTPAEVAGMTDVVAISGGADHSLVLKSDGSVWAWGGNDYGQLGIGTQNGSATPVQVPGLSSIVAISAGYRFSLALKSDGTVVSWGNNSTGQLGDGTNTPKSSPVSVSGGLSSVIAIAAGNSHSLALKSDGTVWAWGGNGSGQLGADQVGGPFNQVPFRSGSSIGLAGIVSIAAVGAHSLALASDGTVWAWGANGFGQLGNNNPTVYSDGTPRRVVGVGGNGTLSGVVAIAAGGFHSVGILGDGTLVGWGANDDGQLANGAAVQSNFVPVTSRLIDGATAITAGVYYTMILRSDGTVWTSGNNCCGQLGYDTGGLDNLTPSRVPGLTGVTSIAAGLDFSLALQSEAIAAAWGANNAGQLGVANPMAYSSSALKVSTVAGLLTMSGGLRHSLAVQSDGTVWSWGDNLYGQLGDGSTTSSATPVQASTPSGIVSVAAGWDHSLAVRSDGSIWGWGQNNEGELGDGTIWARSAPVPVSDGRGGYFAGATGVAAGLYHSVAVRSDGTVWAWGKNTEGEVGDNTVITRYMPVRVSAVGGLLNGFVAVAAGQYHSLALRSDGTVWAWGQNGAGQLGDGTTVDRHTAVQVMLDASTPLSDVIAIAAGAYHSLALTSAGRLVAWGYNNWGQLGDGQNNNRTRPYTVGTLSAVVAITAGAGDTLVLTSDGTAWALGVNSSGQLGAGFVSPYSGTPVQVTGITGTAAITSGNGHTLALALGAAVPPSPLPELTITASNVNVQYGGPAPVYDYTVTPSTVELISPPTCTSSGSPTTGAGTYPITCSGATAAGYLINYVFGTLTVTKAPLTVTATSLTMPQGGVVPAYLMPQYSGFVNGDTELTAGLTGMPSISTDVSPSTPSGIYPITVTQGSLASANYAFSFVNGTFTVTANALNFFNNYFVTGDYVARGVRLIGTGVKGWATDTITIPKLLADPEGVPDGADIVAAYLYWLSVEDPAQPPMGNGYFRGFPIYGAKVGGDVAYPGVGVAGVLRLYRANVIAYLPMGDQRLLAAGNHVVTLPDSGGAGTPGTLGASLVVIYRVLSASVPMKSVVIYDGPWRSDTTSMQQAIYGFYDASTSGGPDGPVVTYIYSDVASQWHTSRMGAVLDAGYAYNASGNPGSWGVVVASVPVSHGLDGLVNNWKSLGTGAHAGQRGYYEVGDGTWVDLPGAVPGQNDVFVQIDYMCKLLTDGTCDPSDTHLPAKEALKMVGDAFAAHNVNLHFDVGNNYQGEPYIIPAAYAKGGNIVPEETCADGDGQLCSFPGESGVVVWKAGLAMLKIWPRDAAGCLAGGDCTPRFPRSRKDSYHYAFFGHSLAVPVWNTRWATLKSIVVQAHEATITTVQRDYDEYAKTTYCPERVTIAGTSGAPSLNGVFNVVAGSCSDTTFKISTPNVADWTYATGGDPDPEPNLAIYPSKISSISGYSDVGGADTVVTLGKWKKNASQDDSARINVQAGTLMHELGHTLGLLHGGTYASTQGVIYGANCKPNYQSVMNYLFQLDLLGPQHILDFSGKQLDPLIETDGGNKSSWVYSPLVTTTRWYRPWLQGESASPATRHCDGTPIMDTAKMVREEREATLLQWAPGQDINFNGNNNEVLDGYKDWDYVEMRQIGATGSQFVGIGGTVTLGSGGTIAFGSGGTVALGSGGDVTLSQGGIISMGSGGTVTFGSGGTVVFGSGGTVTLGSGGTITLGSGGTVTLGSGGTVTLGSGGTVTLGSGGTVTLGSGGEPFTVSAGGEVTLGSSGGTVTLGSGGTVTLGSGGIVALGSGGIVTMGSGGVVTLGSGGTVTLGSGGTVTLGSGGIIAMGSGGIVTLGSGGTVTLGSGGTVALGSGGIVTLGSGGTVTLGSGGAGTVTLGSGGIVALGSGGTVAMGSGGIVALGSGGDTGELTYETANSVVRPPTEPVKTPVQGGIRLDWNAPVFGVISGYDLYQKLGDALHFVTSVHGNPPPTTVTVSGYSSDATFVVSTLTPSIPSQLSSEVRESLPSDAAVLKSDQTITFTSFPIAKLYGDPDFAISASASSGLPVSFVAAGVCTVAGNMVHIAAVGTCMITASQQGDSKYNAAPTISRSFDVVMRATVKGFYQPVTMSSTNTVWNTVKGGSTVPMKFNIYIGTDEQTAKTAVMGGSVVLYNVACSSGTLDAIAPSELIATSDTSLHYDSVAGQFVQNFKMPTTKGCYAVKVSATDGSSVAAYFSVSK